MSSRPRDLPGLLAQAGIVYTTFTQNGVTKYTIDGKAYTVQEVLKKYFS